MKTRTDRHFLGMYWRSRQESIEACAARCTEFFAAFKDYPSLSHWYELGESRKEALSRPMDVSDRQEWRRLLDEGRHWTDFDHRLIDDLGFMAGLWNGKSGLDEAAVLITCGAFNEFTGNSVTLEFPRRLRDLSRTTDMKQVFASVVRAWRPEWAGVMSEEAMERRDFKANQPFVDWMLFVCDKWLTRPPSLEPPASCSLLDSGTLIVVQEVPPDAGNHRHQANISRVERALAGKLHGKRK